MCARVSGMQTHIVPQLPRASFLHARSGSSTVELTEGTTLHCSLVLLVKMTGHARFSCFVHTAQSFQTTTDMSWIFIGRAVPAVFHDTRRFFPECWEVLHCVFVKRGCLALT